jgi:hypothetical protein
LEQAKPTDALSPASQELDSLQELDTFSAETIQSHFEPQLESNFGEVEQEPVELEL